MILAIRIAWPCIAVVWCLTIKVAIAESPPTPTQEPKPAQDATRSVQSPFDERVATAKRLMSEHRYEAALLQWQSAYSHREQPWVLLEQARCEHQLGYRRSASVLYKRFLLLVDSGPQRDEAERELAQVREELQKQLESVASAVTNNSAAGKDSGSTLPSVEPKPLVPVDIEAHKGITQVSVGPYMCSVPCRLWLPREIYPVFARGQTSSVGHLVAYGPTTATFVRQRTRTGYRTAGAILLPIGLLTTGLTGLIGTCHSPSGEFDPVCAVAHLTTWPIMSAATIITGLSLLIYASGAPLMLHQVVTSDSSRPTRPQKLQLTGIDISPTPSGGNLMTAFVF